MEKKRGNTGNLRPPRSSEEARELGRKGGIASGAARRRKKAMMQGVRAVLEADIPKDMRKSIERLTGELDDGECTLYAAAVATMLREAIKGDVSAFREVTRLALDVDAQKQAEEIPDDPLSASLRELGESL